MKKLLVGKSGFALFLLCIGQFAIAQIAGEVDDTFNPREEFISQVSNVIPTGDISLCKRDYAGRIVVAGTFSSISGLPYKKLARINIDGSLDISFQPINFNTELDILDFSITPDNSIIIATDLDVEGNGGATTLSKISESGVVSATFAIPAAGPPDFKSFNAIEVLPDGSMLAGRWFSTSLVNQFAELVKLNANGIADQSFSVSNQFFGNGSLLPQIKKISVQGDGKILVCGTFSSFGNIARMRFLRLNADGTLDVDFNPAQTLNGNISDFILLSNGKILIRGTFTTQNGYLSLLHSDGSEDTAFAIGNSFESSSQIKAIAEDANSNIIVGGSFTSFDGVSRKSVLKLTQTGVLNTSFIQTAEPNGDVTVLCQTTGDQVFVSGTFTQFGTSIVAGKVAWLHSNGALDTTKSTFHGTDSGVVCAKQSNEKIIVGGAFSVYNNTIVPKLIRLNTDGTLDSTFQITGVEVISVADVEILPGDKILLAGKFLLPNQTQQCVTIRLLPDGALDTTFTSFFLAPNLSIFNLIAAPDGKFYANGSINGGAVRRFNANGSIDSSFSVEGQNAFLQVSDWEIQPDGKLLVAANFYLSSGSPQKRLIRLNTNGSVDNSFTFSNMLQSNRVNAIQLLPNGQIMVGGSFQSYNNVTVNNVIRINDTGTLDTSFNSIGTGFAGPVANLFCESNGNVIVTSDGNYVMNGFSRVGVSRLLSNGTLDSAFAQRFLGLSSARIIPHMNAKLLFFGSFQGYQNSTYNNIVRVHTDVCSPVIPSISDQVICGESFTLADLPAFEAPSLVWYQTNNSTAALTATTPIESGTLYVSDSNSVCPDFRFPVSVLANAVPGSPTGDSLQTITIQDGGVAYITALVVAGENIYWYANEQNAVNDVNRLMPFHELVSGATYYAMQTVAGCRSLVPLQVTVNLVLSQDEFSSVQLELKGYPNPSKSYFTVSSNFEMNTLEVFDSVGKQIYSSLPKSKTFTVDTALLTTGIYFVRIKSDNQSAATIKLIKN